MENQCFCLRWNNHNSTVFKVVEELFHKEAFTDCRFISVDGGEIRCHKIILAACSTHFKEIFLNTTNESPVIFLPDTSVADLKAIIEFMYTGEVNINQDQLPGLIRIATLLKIKGLSQEDPMDLTNENKREEPEVNQASPRNISTSSLPSVRSSSSSGSPPHSTSGLAYKSMHNIYERQPHPKREPQTDASWPVSNNPSPYHSIPTFPQSSPSVDIPLRNRYENTSDLPPIKRKRRSSFTANNRDTPILRTVLGQNQEKDTSQSSNLVCHPNNNYTNTYPSATEREYLDKGIKNEPCETERSYTSNLNTTREEPKSKMATPLSPQYINELHNFNTNSISYIAPQKTHRYKQYTSSNLQQAIEAVRCGKMSALKAATFFNIPSRTLYDKIKKLGIIRGRPKRSPNGINTTNALPRRRSGTNSPSDEQLSEADDINLNNHVSYINPLNYLQQNKYEQDCDDNENLTITHKDELPPNTAANYYLHYNKIENSPGSRNEHHSPMFRNENHSPISRNNHSPLSGSEHHTSRIETNENYVNNDNDEVEDLSMKKTRVIMSPKSQMSNSILIKEEMLKEAILEESRREVSVEEVK